MTAPELSPAERAVVERFEAACPARESLRERVAEAMWNADTIFVTFSPDPEWERFKRLADAAIAVMRGKS